MRAILEPIERELAKTLRMEYIRKGQYEVCDRPSIEKAKAMLTESGYLTTDEWTWKPVYMWVRSKLNWDSIIDQSMSQEVFREAAADVIRHHNV
jgi:hypothetical protein